MSRYFLGTLIGVLVSAFCSLMGVAIARMTGGGIVPSAILVHVAAAVVLLVNLLFRMEASR